MYISIKYGKRAKYIGENENNDDNLGTKSMLRICHTCEHTCCILSNLHYVFRIYVENMGMVRCSPIRSLISFWCVTNPSSLTYTRPAISTVCTGLVILSELHISYDTDIIAIPSATMRGNITRRCLPAVNIFIRA